MKSFALTCLAISLSQATAQAATIPYSEDFNIGAPDFTSQSVTSAYASTTNSWSLASGTIRSDVASGTIRSKALATMSNAYSLLTSGMDILMNVDVNIPNTGTGVNTGIGALLDVPVVNGTADGFFGFHGWEAYIRVQSSPAMKMAIYDYAGTDAAGAGDQYIQSTGGVLNASTAIAGLTYDPTETYRLSLLLHQITAAESVTNAGKVQVTFSLTDPSGTGGGPVTGTVTGTSVGLLTLQSGSGQQFGLYSNANSALYAGVFDNFSVIAIPEPGTLALLTAALMVPPLRRRKQS
jgi:hypothetical protein